MYNTSHLLLADSYNRSNKPNNDYGLWFVLVVLCFISVEYIGFVLLSWVPLLPCLSAKIILILYHILTIMVLWSLYMAVTTDPGTVPLYWGFHIGEESKRRRYCKMCNVWKPERTHHCSICNRCNLNMDHHCPWINNCVGFYNRKFFIQLLLYVYSTLILYIITGIYPLYIHLREVIIIDIRLLDICDVIIILSYIIAIFFMVTLTNFIKFHLGLVMDNSTTIENLDSGTAAAAAGGGRSTSSQISRRSKYDIGKRSNIEQVMGSSVLWWFIPHHNNISKPVGDGVSWIKEEEKDKANSSSSIEMMVSSTKHL